jgi:phosphatidylcholine synthase
MTKGLRQMLCWGVHLYTALGLVAAAGIALLIFQGGADAFRWAFILMFVATFIDATDGTMARALDIKKVLPGFDGRRLDDIVDFHTYTSLPLLLVWRAEILPPGFEWTLIVALLASAYGFCQTNIKTDDGYFLGFPSYWNLVAFYLYLLPMPGWLSVGLVLTLAVLTFVPTRYLYPSMGGRLNMVTNVLGALWGLLLVWIVLVSMPAADGSAVTMGLISLSFPVFYMAASWVVTFRVWQRGRVSSGGNV